MLLAILATTAVLSLAGMASAANRPPESTQVGVMKCSVSPGVGLIITSRKALKCNFESAGSGRPDRYVGSITKLGVDIGATTSGELVWTVYRVGAAPRHGGLAGNYAGVGAEATVAVGLGANALVGGPARSISLQPFSVAGQTGLNIALGVSELTLESAR